MILHLLLCFFFISRIGGVEKKIYTVIDDFTSGSEAFEGDRPTPKLWAVLVAGSNGYYNYRHQADVCHAYQLLRRNGLEAENIVVMMYDDVARDEENPTPGVLINRPNGTNVYAGVLIDYKGEDVNPKNFMSILLGDAESLRGVGTGKVLNSELFFGLPSGPNDHVFINFVDHGAPGLVAFPSDELHAKELEKTLLKMVAKKRFGKLLFYLEVDLENETLQNQFLIVRNETNTSHVQEFGDMRLRNLAASQFLGYSTTRLYHEKIEMDPAETVDVPRIILEKKLLRASSHEEKMKMKRDLMRLHKMRKLVSKTVMDIISEVVGGDVGEQSKILRFRQELKNYHCYERTAKFFSKNCFSIAKNSYVTRKLYVLVNFCERGWEAETIIEAMANTCHTPELTGIV